jgi:hypothetical protein
MSTFKYARADVIDRFRPELDAILQSLIWSFSVAVNAPSPGDQLQNVRYLSDHQCMEAFISSAESLGPCHRRILIRPVLIWFVSRFTRYSFPALCNHLRCRLCKTHRPSRRASGVRRGLQPVVRAAARARRAQHWRALGVAAIRRLYDGRGVELATRCRAPAAAAIGSGWRGGGWRRGHCRRKRWRRRHHSAARHGLAAPRLCDLAAIRNAVSRRFDRQFSGLSVQWPVRMLRIVLSVIRRVPTKMYLS